MNFYTVRKAACKNLAFPALLTTLYDDMALRGNAPNSRFWRFLNAGRTKKATGEGCFCIKNIIRFFKLFLLPTIPVAIVSARIFSFPAL